MSNIAILTLKRLINPESCTPEREITLADLKEKQWLGNILYESYFLLEKNPALSEVQIYVFDSLLKHHLTIKRQHYCFDKIMGQGCV